MKLELKHLSPYLPYGLNGVLQYDCQEDFSELIISESDESKFHKGSVWKYSGYVDGKLCIPIGEGEIDGFVMSFNTTYACFTGVCRIKPILRPLSDLTIEIEVNGQKFVPNMNLTKGREIVFENNSFWYEKSESTVSGNKKWCGAENQLQLFEKLLEWKFDVYGLIEKGLAIDINTL